MRIAQVAPLFESVPPSRYGGTERIVHYLTEELVRRGHDVVLFASGDSRTSARLHACATRALRLADVVDATIYEIMELEQVYRRAAEFDLVHFHTGHLHYPTSQRMGFAHITTQHGRLDIAELQDLYRLFERTPLVSISDAQRAPVPHANWVATVHHGLPPDLHRFSPGGGNYFAFVGRISPEKRADRAIEIARAAGVPLRIAAKVDRADRDYYESRIKPLLKGDLVEYLGEVTDEEKQDLVGGALALLFPIDWPEPFGLVMIESMACGTPVIAWRNGSTPEVMRNGVSGFLVDSMEEAVAAAARVGTLDRAAVRRYFEERFTSRRMAEEYERVYRRVLAGRAAEDWAAPRSFAVA